MSLEYSFRYNGIALRAIPAIVSSREIEVLYEDRYYYHGQACMIDRLLIRMPLERRTTRQTVLKAIRELIRTKATEKMIVRHGHCQSLEALDAWYRFLTENGHR